MTKKPYKPAQSVPEDVEQTWKAYKADPSNQELRNRLVENYLPLVRYNGARIHSKLPQGVELDDLVSAGVFGLMDAIDAFDLSRGVKFETYCVPRIRGAMLDELRIMDWVPRLVRSKSTRVNKAKANLEKRLGRTPEDHEVAAELGIDESELATIYVDASRTMVQILHYPSREEATHERPKDKYATIPDPREKGPSDTLSKNDFLRTVTKGLNRNERLLIIGYYYEDQTMKEIGENLDLSESRVSQMHSAIIARMSPETRARLLVYRDAA